jgi:hypothetical protein
MTKSPRRSHKLRDVNRAPEGRAGASRLEGVVTVDDNVRGLGRAIFAAVLLMIGGVLNIIYGIAAISNSHFFDDHTSYVFGSLHTWGWITLILGVIELLASASLFGGGTFGRWFGIFAASLVAIESLLQIPSYPFLGIAIFALSLWIIYGLVIYGEPEGRVSTGPS